MKININTNRLEFIKHILKEYPKGYGVEVGTFKGEFSKHILENWDGVLYMVDVWRGLDDKYDDSSNHKFYDEKIYGETIKNISGYEERAIMIRSTSASASEIFRNESLDFVYIDANHAYDYVVEDIEYWFPKVKKGGYLMGHDYIQIDWYNDPNFAPNKKDKYIWAGKEYTGLFGVNPAVDEFCEKTKYDLSLTSEYFGTWAIKKN